MDTIVLIKHVPDRVEPVDVDENFQIVTGALVFDLGEYDLMALEEALHLKELGGSNGEVTVITVAPEPGEDGLRKALEMGADRAVRIWNESLADYDQWTVAAAVYSLVNTLAYDLILTGYKSGVAATGLVGTYLAGILNIPCITGVVETQLNPGNETIQVKRHIGKGDRLLLESPLPAVLAVEKSHASPRYPTMANRLKAAQADIPLFNPYENEENRLNRPPVLTELVRISKARLKPKKIFTPDSNLSAADRMKMILSGGMSKKKGPVGERSNGETGAQQIIDHLMQMGLVKRKN